MAKLIYNRLLQLVAVVFGVGALTFVLMRSLPGDMAFRIASSRYGQDNVSAEAAEFIRQELNLNQSGISTFFSWLVDLAQFNLGNSLVSGQPVSEIVSHQLGHSLLLAVAGIVLSVLLAFALGFASVKWQRWFEPVAVTLSIAVRALPVFVIGLVLILIFSLYWQWLPVAGFDTPQHLILPTATLAIALAATSNRIVATSTRQVIRAPFYQFSMMKGLTPWRTFQRHGVRNILLPVVAFIGIQFITVIEGIVMIESLFSWPGVGHGLAHAIFARDIPVIQGTALCLGVMFVMLNMIVDLLCYWIDPRIKEEQ
ncbi:ABC transporter permease [Vibrio ziniensis]|uniref:ABC transporter permease n=1 Tax=Vibrio ziniensis TaxID=2711221 RepID=A0A6G7CNP3_9VIBR|nr:ABC transporter permease [Vibrio ziniensis]QIH43725.1 ABC transporter permease [Vibrio ziniensis]